ncbi:hypothetical protein Lal_00007717 [Lupinus albus]|nr:hypothetical protein Lal_00007717 [Lupinus albus]
MRGKKKVLYEEEKEVLFCGVVVKEGVEEWGRNLDRFVVSMRVREEEAKRRGANSMCLCESKHLKVTLETTR